MFDKLQRCLSRRKKLSYRFAWLPKVIKKWDAENDPANFFSIDENHVRSEASSNSAVYLPKWLDHDGTYRSYPTSCASNFDISLAIYRPLHYDYIMIDFSYTGHESFQLRISWLPKAIAALESGIDPFSDPREGMTHLGLGKNMIQSLAYWVVVTGLAEKTVEGLQPTDFAEQTLSRKTGNDPFLENTQTLWLLHWNLCQGWKEEGRSRQPYAWFFFANKLMDDELAPSSTIERYTSGPLSRSTGKELSYATLHQHFEVFIKTYVAGRANSARSTPEDTLDSPLTTLGLIKESHDRNMLNGKRETVYRVNNAAKPTISKEVFRHCLHEWWTAKHPDDKTLTVRQITTDDNSPGRCFRLPETSIHEMLTRLSNSFSKEFKISETRQQRTVSRLVKSRPTTTLKSIYHP